MIQMFKSWINLILCMGILFCIIQLIIPNTKLKKYTYSLIGIVTIITFLTPVIKMFKNLNVSNVSDIFLNVENAQTMSMNKDALSKFEAIKDNSVKENFKASLEGDIRNKLKEKIHDFDVNVEVTKDYNIEKIIIHTKENVTEDITTYISNEYDITRDKVELSEGK